MDKNKGENFYSALNGMQHLVFSKDTTNSPWNKLNAIYD